MSRESKDSRTTTTETKTESKKRAPAEAVPVEVFKNQISHEVEQMRNNIHLAVALGKHGDSEKVTRKHLSHLVSQQTKRMRSLINQFKRSVGARRERKNLAEWSKLHPVEAKSLTPSSADQPHLFDRRLAQLVRGQDYSIKVPREGTSKTGRMVIQGSEDATLNLNDYVRDHEGHALSTKANMRALLGLYINQVGRPGKKAGVNGSSPVIDLSTARDFQTLFRDAVREAGADARDVSDWRAVPYATAMSLISMLDAPHYEYLKSGKKAMELPRVANLAERIKSHKRALNWMAKEKSAGRPATSAPAPARAPSPRRSRK